MINLIKYEWRRKWLYVIGLMIIILLLNIGIYMRGYNPEKQMVTLIFSNMGIFFAGFLTMLIMHIRKIYLLLFTDEGPFTFLTPLNGYEILGSNLLGALLDSVLLLLFTGGVMLFNLQINDTQFIEEAVQMIKLSGINVYEAIPTTLTTIFLNYSLLLITIYLSMILVKTLLYNIRFKKILSFVVFLFMSRMNTFINDIFVYHDLPSNGFTFNYLVLILLKTSLVFAVWYMISGYLLEERVSA